MYVYDVNVRVRACRASMVHVLSFCLIPTLTGSRACRSRMVARLHRNFATGWLARLIPRWAKHLPRMAVLDQVRH